MEQCTFHKNHGLRWAAVSWLLIRHPWNGLCPGNDESAGKQLSGKTRKGSPRLRKLLVEAAHAANHCKYTFDEHSLHTMEKRLIRCLEHGGSHVSVRGYGSDHVICRLPHAYLHQESFGSRHTYLHSLHTDVRANLPLSENPSADLAFSVLFIRRRNARYLLVCKPQEFP